MIRNAAAERAAWVGLRLDLHVEVDVEQIPPSKQGTQQQRPACCCLGICCRWLGLCCCRQEVQTLKEGAPNQPAFAPSIQVLSPKINKEHQGVNAAARWGSSFVSEGRLPDFSMRSSPELLDAEQPI